jgi:hypothetical protein
MEEAVAAGAGITFRLTPRKDYPGGSYNSSIYTQASISGQTLTLTGAPGRAYIELQLDGWGPQFLRIWETYIDATGYSSGLGTDLVPAVEPCASGAECQADFGSGIGPFCSSGVCTFAWINRSRSDGIQIATPVAPCSTNIWDVGNFSNPTGHNYFGVLDTYDEGAEEHCGLPDPGTIQYAGAFAVDVLAGSRGTYTIGLQAEVTIAQDDTSPDNVAIPIAALVPAIIHIPCTTIESCDDGNGCTSDACHSGTCHHSLLPSGTNCGSSSTAGCDAQDTCNVAGICVARVKAGGTVCRLASGFCDVAEVCDGVSAACPVNGFLPNGSVCEDENEPCADPRCIDGICTGIDNCSCAGVACGDGCCVHPTERVSVCAADCADLGDMADLFTCVRTAAYPPGDLCLDFDIDGDDKITLLDYSIYEQRHFGGP